MEYTHTNNINVCINPHLIEANFRFIKVAKQNKRAVETGWNKTQNYSHDAPELAGWVDSGGNYGVLGSKDHIIIDTDNEELASLLSELPETFTVRSGSGRGLHAYFKCKNNGNITLYNPNNSDENFGNVQATGKYVVGPGSIHPSGGVYEVETDVPVAEVPIEEIERVFDTYIHKKREIDPDEVKRGYGLWADVFDEISLFDVGCFPVNPIDRGNGEIQGAHPLHGSSGGMNFSINTRKNTWFCFRHSAGGGPLEWLAVAEGIIDCSDAGHGCLRGEKFTQVLEVAKSRGFKISIPKKLPPHRPKILDDDDDEDEQPGSCPSTPEPTPPPRGAPSDGDDILADFLDDDTPSHIPPLPVPHPPPDSPTPPPPERRITNLTQLPDTIPDADVVLIDAPPRLGKTHRVVTWAAEQCNSANIITTSHSIVEQQLRIFREYKNSISTAVHLEGKERCCLKKESGNCKMCEFYPFDGENFLDIRQYVRDLLNEKKVLTKENVNNDMGVTYCPYYIIKHAEPFADYCFTVIANIDRVSNRSYTFIDEDPSIAHFFANSVELLEATFHVHHASATSKLEEKWAGIEKYKKYLDTHRHKGKKTLLRVIEILEQFRAVLNVENMTRSTRESLIEELSLIDTSLPELDGTMEAYELIDHVKRFEYVESLSPFVEALLFQYEPHKFIWSGSNPSTLYLVADGDQLMRPAPDGKIVVIGSTRAELFVKALGRDYKVIRIPKFNYSDWFAVIVIRDESKKASRKLMEQVLKKLARTNEEYRYPVLVLTGSEKDQKKLKSVLGGIAHCSSDENQIGQLWNKRGGYINIFYQNSVISRGIDVDFYDMLFVYSSDFANPYWTARLNVAHETRNMEERDFVKSIIDAIVVDETTNSVLRISPVRTTQDRIPRVVVICDNDLWKIKEPVINDMKKIGVDADFFEKKGWERILEPRKIGLYDAFERDPKQAPSTPKKPDMDKLELEITDTGLSEQMDWRESHNKNNLKEIEEQIRNYLKAQQAKGRRSSEITLSNNVIRNASDRVKNDAKHENVLRIIIDMVKSGEVIRVIENSKSFLTLRERYVPPEVKDAGQFNI